MRHIGCHEPNAADKPDWLIVDDPSFNLQILKQGLQNDHNVRLATSGQQTLDACEQALPDLILPDVVMPGHGRASGLHPSQSEPENPGCPGDFRHRAQRPGRSI